MCGPDYTFSPLTSADLQLLFRWVAAPHVKKWWDSEGEGDWELFRQRYQANIECKTCFPHIVCFEDKPIGYINYWDTTSDPNFSKMYPIGAVGTDQFVGEVEFIGKGHGSRFVKQFTDALLDRYQTVITDPDTENIAAIKCYLNAGFVKVDEIKVDDEKIMLMEKRALSNPSLR